VINVLANSPSRLPVLDIYAANRHEFRAKNGSRFSSLGDNRITG
jgi:hypothetical protein